MKDRVERQLELPDGFMDWPDRAKIDHFLSVRARILQWNRHDREHQKYGSLLGKMEYTWLACVVAVFLGFAEFALGMLLEGIAAASLFTMGMLAREFYQGCK